MFCRHCGHALYDHMTFCPGCGAPVHRNEAAVESRTPAKDSSVIDSGSSKKSGLKPLSRKNLLYAVAAVLIILILLAISALLKKDTRDRLEEKLRLGAAYLEEMNFDMALDAYAAAIEIDERDPRPYLGRADVYMGRAAEKLETAQEDEAFDSAAQDLAMAEQDIQKAEELIGAEDYAPEEEELVTQDDINAYRESKDQLQKEEETKRNSNSFAGKIVEEVLGLPYIGNTSYNEFIYSDLGDLDFYDGRGYISATSSDLDGDGEDEIFVVSLEGENTLGHGRNSLLFHVLEKQDNIWTEQARLDPEQDSGRFYLTENTSFLEEDIYLRPDENRTAVYTEICGHERLDMEISDWAFCKYIYDGSTLLASSIGSLTPYEFYFSGPYYDFTEPIEDAYDDEGRTFRERFRGVKQKLTESGLPSPVMNNSFAHKILDSDEHAHLTASFYRSLDYHSGVNFPIQTLVSLVDWTYAERSGETSAEITIPPEVYQLALYHHTFKTCYYDFRERTGNDGYAQYSYYDIDQDGIFELIINKFLSWSENNKDLSEPVIYTIRNGTAVKIPLDYAVSEGEYCVLDVSRGGKTLLYTCKQRDLDQYRLEYYSNYIIYEITLENGTAKTDYLSEFTGSIDEVQPHRCLPWFDVNEKPDFRTVDLLWRFHAALKTEYYLETHIITGNELSGNLLMPMGDGVFYGGTAVIHMEDKTADVIYNDDLNDLYGTEHLDLH